MATFCTLSPTPSTLPREDSVTPSEYKPIDSATRMMKITSLLNPTGSDSRAAEPSNGSISPPSTPAYSAQATPRPGTPDTPSSGKRQKLVKDGAVFTRGKPNGRPNYPPYESDEVSICLSHADRKELSRQHKLFRIYPSGSDEEGFIGDHTRHIPYSSDKKNFSGKTGRDGFDVFQYTFCVPEDQDGKSYVVMWDYDNGLVRITPFFKACKYSKTTPAKALTTNPGLKDLAHSITGGALAAQGYWMPYQCARAICATFCYKIRWALTPIFGASFLRECLPPNHPDFGKFKIASETVRCAQLESEGWKASPNGMTEARDIPRSVPEEGIVAGGKALRPRGARPKFKLGSPFDSEGDASEESNDSYGHASSSDSPNISPKTSIRDSPGWTSINSPHRLPSPPNNTPVGSLSTSLLTQPRYAPWRHADPRDNDGGTPPAVKMPTGAHDKHRIPKRRRSSVAPTINYHEHSGSDAGASSSESDDVDIIVSPRPRKAKKHVHLNDGNASASASSTTTVSTKKKKYSAKSKKFTAEDARAAKLLLSLHELDADLAVGPNGPVGVASRMDESL
ncbi:hypothetical protein LTR37_012641 [Vermiconidia calcicola]|uniref:Uncharacterized protein n=1 Tax=Vermiconidia calcicola TaxID=1690605 RepID=A0ACC3MYQ3_9PEZI|nr:hypothetical protein LTR37_012641 [Vermiconidia calcicola]